MGTRIAEIVEVYDVQASAPCRVDMGGTLDIGTFYYPLQHAGPCTFNLALKYAHTCGTAALPCRLDQGEFARV
jgi:hypothetical protein